MMVRRDTAPTNPRPATLAETQLPRHEDYYPSPADWQDEVLYFLLPDRFSDGKEDRRPLLDRSKLSAARPATFRFDQWAQSGGDRWQGGTIAGIRSKLDYIKGLGATALWCGPTLKQRSHLDTFHGYAIQDFLEIDERFGTRKDLMELVDAAHRKGMRVILDVVFNHSGCNWLYANAQRQPPYLTFPNFYQKGLWFDADGSTVPMADNPDTGVWPRELQEDTVYSRAGGVDFGGALDDPHAPFRRTDFFDLRDFNYEGTDLLAMIARCYKYWIALTDCDGFRLDTLKHVSHETGRNFCGAIKEFAANLGKHNFFLVGEVAGSDDDAARYREVLGHNLNATLDIGGIRRTLHSVAKGLLPPRDYLGLVDVWDDELGSHRASADKHVSILDDHDHASGEKVRYSMDAATDQQVVAGVALQLFSLGIPCIYYGTEQSFAGPERAAREKYLPDLNPSTGTDKYLREAMFGPEHPLLSGRAGHGPSGPVIDPNMPGFGAFGTVGHHCFNTKSPAYVRIAALTGVRQRFPVLQVGRQYQREISNFKAPFALPEPGELIGWSRILDDEEALCIVNGHGSERRGGDVVVDLNLNAGAMLEVVANTEQAGSTNYQGKHPVGTQLPVMRRDGGPAYVEIRDVGPSEVIVLVNHP